MIIFDIETDGLRLEDVTKIHCIALRRIFDRETPIVVYENSNGLGDMIEHGIRAIQTDWDPNEITIGHNIIAYDIPVIQKFYPWFQPKKVIDTLVLSRLLEPDRKEGRSLEAYAKQFGKNKVQNTEWSVASGYITERCRSDVEITKLLFEYLVERAGGIHALDGRPINIEHSFAKILNAQQNKGWYFCKEKAIKLSQNIQSDLSNTERALSHYLKPICKKIGVINKPFKKDGSYSSQCERYKIKPDGPISVIEYNPLNLSSPSQLKKLLTSLGWKPTEWNTKKGDREIRTSAKLTEDSYDTLPGELGKLLARRNKLQHRLKLLLGAKGKESKGLIANVRIDGRIEAGGIPCATNTGRTIHTTVVNIPKTSKLYGQELRELFSCEEGRLLVGCDASGIQWRIAAHYINNPEVIEVVSNGDIHEYVNQIARLDNRDIAKQLGFGILFGGGINRVAIITGRNEKEASQIRTRIINDLPGLKSFIQRVKYACKKGYLLGLDGRKLYFRKIYSAPNLLIQSAEAIIMKNASINIYNDIERNQWDAFQVGMFHDEFIFDCEKNTANLLTSTAINAIKLAGKELNVRCPLDAKAKIGNNWATIH